MQFTIDGKLVDLDRIYACVNALAGVEDPEAFMRTVLELLGNIADGEDRKALDSAVNASKHLKGGE